jgi:hypothetical protein
MAKGGIGTYPTQNVLNPPSCKYYFFIFHKWPLESLNSDSYNFRLLVEGVFFMSKEIIVCPSCNGRGRYTEEQMRIGSCYGNNLCEMCKGKGRMVKEIRLLELKKVLSFNRKQ